MVKRLIVEPTQCLIVDEISIRVEDLKRYEIIEITAEMVDNSGDSWSSMVMVQANVFGEVDLVKAIPILGSYTKPCSMGLFWSMKRRSINGVGMKTPLQPLKTTITLRRNGAAEEVIQVIRHLVHPSLIRQPIIGGKLTGTFFHHGDQRKRPTILVLGGSEGGLREAQAALIAAKGFNALALAYFGMKGLHSKLVNIPLEYLQEALDWLEQHQAVDEHRIGVVGTSKGGELALLLASYESRIKSIAAYVPSSVIHKGLGETDDGDYPSSWSYLGKPLTFAYNDEKIAKLTKELADQRNVCRKVSYREWYRVHAEAATDRAVIQVEKVNGPVLVISGEDDQLWPSNLFGEQIINRLSKHSFRFPYEHLCYTKAGHAIGYPGMPTTESTEFKFGHFALEAGGTPEENFKAQADSWKKVISFLKQSL